MESYKVEVKSHLYTHPSETTMTTILVYIPYDLFYAYLSIWLAICLSISSFIHKRKYIKYFLLKNEVT